MESGGGKTNLLEAAGSAADRVRVHLMGDTCEVLRGLLLEELKPGRGHGRGCGREHMPESAFLPAPAVPCAQVEMGTKAGRTSRWAEPKQIWEQ